MNVKKFYSHDARIALKKVKETLGADAVILSNRKVDGQIEIMAVTAREMATMAQPVPQDQPRKRIETADQAERLPRMTPPRDRLASAYAAVEDGEASLPPVPPVDEMRLSAMPYEPPRRPLSPPPTVIESEAGTAALMDELKALRRVVEQHLAGYAWSGELRGEPVRAEVLRRLLDAGFSPRLVNDWLTQIAQGEDVERAVRRLQALAETALPVGDLEANVIDQGGVYALVGPTGVGKTTTTAKLAARCVLRHGRDRVALITTDGYRIGAHEQLRIYGRILGVPVFAVKDAAELKLTLAELSTRHLVLIDTMGMSQKDRQVLQQRELFRGCGVQRLLLLNATSRGDTLDDVVAAYGGEGLAGCVLTKIDEAVSLAPAIDAVIRHRLRVAFVCNGQRVPEDLHLPNRAYLVHRAFKEAAEGSPHRMMGDQPEVVMAGSGVFPKAASVRHA